MSHWGEQFNAPAARQRREQWLRSFVARQRSIDTAITQAKAGNPHLLLDLVEPEDVRRAIAALLPARKKRGRKFSAVGMAVKRLRRMLQRQRDGRGGRQVPHGTRAALVERLVTALLAQAQAADTEVDEFWSTANSNAVSAAIMARLHKGERHRN